MTPFTLDAASLPITITALVIAGWAGRDAAAVQHHIDELAAIGVKPPRVTPLFYRVGAGLLTTGPAIEVAGTGSTGEAEAVLIGHAGEMLVGVGSDHTDRMAEAAGVTWSKQMCPKPVSAELWRYADVEPHWDRLELSSLVLQNGVWRDYQRGAMTGLRHPDDLVARYTGTARLDDGTAMYCGTMPAIAPISFAQAFAATLFDPVLGRTLVCRYAILALPLAD
ncbi:MAG: DUF2848 domain-containing protein [Acetobacteraceae bacterium]|nr:DUF2848 domain-containing protein [Acetobacteraceae bacterium]